ncbi:MAG: M28 family peptidase, partial [Gemmatimonadota bacterium]
MLHPRPIRRRATSEPLAVTQRAAARLLLALMVLAGAACAARQARPQADAAPAPVSVPAEGLELIDEAQLRRRLAVFAADSMEGRRAGTTGGDRAAAYLARELRGLGVETVGGQGSFLHRFAIEDGGSEAIGDSTQNVVGWIAGSDPALAGQIVAIGAHYDGLGIGPAVDGDSIYNGADDDGTGSMALLELAEALTRGPRPRRSILIAFHGGEEAGLLGS